MSDNVLIAIIAACAVVISAVFVLGGAVFAWIGSNKRLDKIDAVLERIQGDLTGFYRLHVQLEAKVDSLNPHPPPQQ